jgi:predicted phage terminase large subunit-like protein
MGNSNKETGLRKRAAYREFLYKSLACSSLANFIEYTMPEYVMGWVHELICKALDKFLTEVINKKSPRLIITAPPRHGKLCADSTPVPTTSGWKTHGELKVGDSVFGVDGQPTKVLAVGESDIADYEVVFSNQERIKAHGNHEWTLVNLVSGMYSTKETAELFQMNGDGALGGKWFLPDRNQPGKVAEKTWNNRHFEWDVYITDVLKSDSPEAGRCIQVDAEDGLYLVGRTCVPTHNSEIISRRFPAYVLGKYPNLRIISTSYTADLASQMNRDVQRVITSEAFKELFPCTKLAEKGVENNQKYTLTSEFFQIVNAKGSYRSAGVGGGITGMGGDCLLIDDPIKDKKDAESATVRKDLWEWYQAVFSTRCEPGAGIAIVHTRWHEDDLVGRLLDAEKQGVGCKWEVINFPAIAEHDEEFRKQGEPLFPERYDLETLENIKKEKGSAIWAALFQQRPAPDEGQIFKKDWFKYWTRLPDKFDKIILSWDMAFKDTDSSDFVVGQVWGRIGSECYLIDQTRGRMGFVETCDAFKRQAEKWPKALTKLVEDKANGPAVIDALKRRVQGIIPIQPDGSKTSRAHAITALFEAGNVYFPSRDIHLWVDDLETELLSFPVGMHDDQVDALTQALRKLSKGAGSGNYASAGFRRDSGWDMAW